MGSALRIGNVSADGLVNDIERRVATEDDGGVERLEVICTTQFGLCAAALAQSRDEREASVGMRGYVEQIVLPGTELIAKPSSIDSAERYWSRWTAPAVVPCAATWPGRLVPTSAAHSNAKPNESTTT